VTGYIWFYIIHMLFEVLIYLGGFGST